MAGLTLQVCGGVLLVCLGVLLGTTWTIQALQSQLRRQAVERRRLDEEWRAVCAAHRRRRRCLRCGSRLTEEQMTEEPPDDG